MNKHFHRIIFNAVRGIRMVVQETATSTGKGSSKATTTGAQHVDAAGAKRASVVVAGALYGVLVAVPGHTQIVGAPDVLGKQRPTVLVAPNGVPYVNIQTPSAAGVSRNVYNQFNVGANGAILNNSRTTVQSQLGGYLQGNPYLATGPARIIVNEVNGGNPSQIRGYLEVAGQRAEIIIANPAGISVDGGGFINASRATLTTGTPQFNAFGGLDGFLVRGGTVTIDGAGLDATRTDYAAILARAVQLNAAIYATDLKVVTGANQVSADHSQITPTAGTGAAPTFALDVAALGGMYAGKIVLVGTEQGLGVRNAGNIGASAGSLIVTAAGRLENTGTLEGMRVGLASAGDIDNRGGTIRQASSIGLTITSPTLSNTNGGVIGAEPAPAPAAVAGGGAGTGGSTGTDVGGTPSTGTGQGVSGAATAPAPAPAPFVPTTPGTLTATGAILNDGGKIFAGGPIALQTPQIDNAGGTLSVATMAVTGANFSNAGGTLDVSNSFSANVGQLDNTGGKLHAGALNIATSGDLVNTDGVLSSASDAQLAVGGKTENTRGSIAAAGALTLNTSALENTGGSIQSEQAGVQLGVAHALTNGSGASINAGTDLGIQAGSLANDGSVTAGRNTTINADSVHSGTASVLGAGIQSDGKLGGVGDLRVTTTGALIANGTNLAAGNATLQGASVDLSTGQTSAAHIAVTATQGNVVTSKATVVTPGTLAITANGNAAQTLVNDAGQLNAGQLQIDVSNLANTNKGEIVQTGAGATTIATRGTLNNDGSRIASNGQDLALQASAISSDGGTIEHAGTGTLTIDAGSLSNRGGQIVQTGADATRITVVGVADNSAGTIASNGNTTIAVGSLLNQGGKVFGNSLTVDTRGNTLDNSANGTMAATTTVAISSGQLLNDAGLIQSGGAMSIDTNGKALTNTHASGYTTNQGGITSADTLTLKNVGAFDNAAGFIGSKNALDAQTQAFSNVDGGVVLGQAAVTIDTRGARYDNSGGKTQAVGDLSINAGDIRNAGGLVRSLATTTLNAATLNNANTNGTDQGIEGKNVVIGTGNLNNDAGAIRADVNATLTSGGTVTNTNGAWVSAGDTLSIVDPNRANPAAKTLSVVNTGGTLVAGTAAVLDADGKVQTAAFGALEIDAKGFSGDGKTVGANDLRIALAQDVTNNVAVRAGGNLSYATTGKLTNNARLLAGGTVSVSGNDVENTVNAEITGDTTIVTAAHALTNRGLIDGHSTQIDGGTVDNLGTGRIYGDAISIAASTLNNDAETRDGVTKAGTIAARDSLDIGAGTLNNREHALIFSSGDLYIGGALDAHRYAVGQGGTLDNLSADIESLGEMSISMAQVNNRDTHVRLGPKAATPRSFITIGVEGAGQFEPEKVVYVPGQPYVWARNADGSQGALLNPTGAVWGTWYHDSTTTVDTAVDADPARIVAGRGMSVEGRLYNAQSQVLAGGTIVAPGYVSGPRLTGQSATVDVARVYDRFGKYQETLVLQLPPQTITLDGYDYQSNRSATKGYDAGTAPAGAGAGAGAAQAGATTGGVEGAGRQGVVVEVPAATGKVLPATVRSAGQVLETAGADGTHGSTTVPVVVRTSAPRAEVPRASLFRLNPQPGSRYLVETDPRFADYRNWLSSDYLLNKLGLDPNSVLKRLGDGFYEQKLIREQVAQLTGYRNLEGFDNDDDQYAALMNAGVTFAKQYGLRPGVGLSAAQMAQLTSDIVWLVEQTVTLPDGTSQRVLVPQLYVRVRPGDIDGAGSLLSAERTLIEGGGDLVNTGTIAGRTLVRIDKDNVRNLGGGRIAGGSVGIHAKQDLDNIGASITAADAAVLTADRDVNIRTTTQSASGAGGPAGQTSATLVDHVAGVYVSNPGGTLVASAGRDVNLIGAALVSGGSAGVGAGREINLGTVTESSAMTYAGKKTTGSVSQSRDIGSSVVGGNGDVTLDAKKDIRIRGSGIDAQGDLTLKAREGDVRIEAGRATTAVDSTSTSTKKGFLSRKTEVRRDGLHEDISVGSTLGGRNVTVSGRDVTVSGSEVIADKDLGIVAKRELTIDAAQDTRSESSYRGTSKSGLIGSGGFGFTIGSRSQSTEVKTDSTKAEGSTVGSIGGNATLVAGNQYTQTGSSVVSPNGDVTIAAKSILIREARETSRTETEQKQKTGGLTIALTAPVIIAAQSIGNTAKATKQTGSGRMQALAAASMAAEAKGIVDAVASNPAQAMGVNLSISLGGSQNKSNRTETSDNAAGSRVEGSNVTLLALGGGTDSNITVQGSDIVARDTATLVAVNRIDVLAAQSTSDQHSTNKGSGGSVGVSFGTSGLLFNIGANASKGKSDGTDTSYTNSHVSAGKTVNVANGGDMTIKGGVIEAARVNADVGGNLKIESLQDTSTSTSKQQSVGGSLSVGVGVWSVGVTASSAKASGHYASVKEQSGIKARDDGFHVNVKGSTDLQGAVIESTQAAVDNAKNTFKSASLTTSDIQNVDTYKASGASLSAGLSGGSGKNDKATPAKTSGSAGAGNASGKQASTTRSGISGMAGDQSVRTDVDSTNALTKKWNTEQLVSDVQAQAKITQTFGVQATSAWGKYANSKLADAIQRDNKEDIACWSAEGACRIAGHSVIGGLAGGAGGALGAAAGTALVPYLDRVATNAGLSGAAHDAVVAGLAGVVGGALGGSAGAAASFNEVNNNYLTSRDVNYLAGKLAQCAASDAKCRDAVRAEAKVISDKNDKEMLACKDQACVDIHINKFVEGAKAFSALYAADKSDGHTTFGAMSDMQTTGGLIAANLSAGYANFPQWKQANCVALTDAACSAKFESAAANGEILGSGRPPGKVAQAIFESLPSTAGAHQYSHTGIVCDGSDDSCDADGTFGALKQFAGPGAPGTGQVASGSVTDILLLGIFRLGYVTHLVDSLTQSVVNITLPGQHGLDKGWVVRSVDVNASGQTFVNSYGAGTGANPFQVNVWGANPVWGGNVNTAVRPLGSPASTVNSILCQRFGSCN